MSKMYFLYNTVWWTVEGGLFMWSYSPDAVPAGLQRMISQKASKSKIKTGGWFLPVAFSEQCD